jgi:hypothetical protein
VLEVVVPSGHSLPVSFTTTSGEVEALMVGFAPLVHCAESRGKGKIIGPRSAIAEYTFTGCEAEHQECKSTGATTAEEITTGQIEAELVWLDQAKDEVGILMNPGGGTYISFDCGSETVVGSGPFLAEVGPINREALSFTALLTQSESMQTPTTYEGPDGEPLQAIPMATRGGNPAADTGAQATFAISASVPLEVRAITAAEVAATQRAQAAQRESEEASSKHQEAGNRSVGCWFS